MAATFTSIAPAPPAARFNADANRRIRNSLFISEPPVKPSSPPTPVRYGMMLRVKPEHFDDYKRHHAAVWPEVLATITRCPIRNYTIYHREGLLLFSFEYWGDDYTADMRKMAADPATQRWWAIMEPMQDPLPTRAPGEWWAPMEEVFHLD